MQITRFWSVFFLLHQNVLTPLLRFSSAFISVSSSLLSFPGLLRVHFLSVSLLCICSLSLSVQFPLLHVSLTVKAMWDSAAFFPPFPPHPPCRYCLNILYMFRLTCIVYCLVLCSHVRSCCVSSLVSWILLRDKDDLEHNFFSDLEKSWTVCFG